MPRYKLRTLLILLAVGPPLIWWFGPGLREAFLDAYWLSSSPGWQTSSTVNDQIFANGKTYGRIEPGDVVSMKSRGRVYVNGKLRQPIEK
jgi:hypothetical protein